MIYSKHSILIRDHNGQPRFRTEINVGSKARYTLMKEDCLTIKFYSTDFISFKMGDYIDVHDFFSYDGKDYYPIDEELAGIMKARFYELTDSYVPQPKDNGYAYEMTFQAYYFKWKNKKFKFVTSKPVGNGTEDIKGITRVDDKNIQHRRAESSWYLTAKIEEHLDMLIENLYVLGHHYDTWDGNKITYAVHTGDIVEKYRNGYIPMYYDNMSILDAIYSLAKECECDCWIDGNVIHIGRLESAEEAMELSVWREIKTIEASNSSKTYATRLFVYGSDNNLPATYRKRLIFTSSEAGTDIKDMSRRLKSENFSDDCFEYKTSRVNIPSPNNDDLNGILGNVGNFHHTNVTYKKGTGETTIKVYKGADENVSNLIGDLVFVQPASVTFTPETTTSMVLKGRICVLWHLRYDVVSSPINLDPITLQVHMSYTEKESGETKNIEVIRKPITPKKSAKPNQAIAYGELEVNEALGDLDLDNIVGDIKFTYTCYTTNDCSFYYLVQTENLVLESRSKYPVVNTKVKVGGNEYDAVLNPYHVGSTDDRRYMLQVGTSLPKGTEYTITKGLLISTLGMEYFSDEEDNFVAQSISKRRLMLPTTPDADDEFPYTGHGYLDAYENMTSEEIVEDSIVIDDIKPEKTDKVVEVIPYDFKYEDNDENTGKKEGAIETRYLIKTEYFSEHYDDRYRLNGVENPTLVFCGENSSLSGFEFDVVFDPTIDGTFYKGYFRIVPKNVNEITLPNDTLKPKVGDEFNLYGYDCSFITESDLVGDAEKRLLERGREYLKRARYQDVTYNMTTYELLLGIGDRVKIEHPSYFEDNRIVRVIGYEICLDIPQDNPKYTMGESVAYSRISSLEEGKDNTSIVASTTGITSRGGGGSQVTIIGLNSKTMESDTNVYSSLRAKNDFLSKTRSDSTPYDLGMRNLHVRRDAHINGTAYAENVISDNMTSSDFREGGMDGAGVGVYSSVDGGHVETDYLSVRKASWFRELTIEEVKHVGGEMILSSAACRLSRVEGYNESLIYDSRIHESVPEGVEYFRCYFEKESNGKNNYNEWVVGDQARCQSFGNASAGTQVDVRTSYYWRLVVGTGETNEEFYVDLSNSLEDEPLEGCITHHGCDNGCTPPQPNDNVVLLGCRRSEEQYMYRRSAQVYSTIGDNAPSRRYYTGITDFNFPSPIENMEYVAKDGQAHWNVGNGTEYIDFSKDGLKIVASQITMSGSGKNIEDIFGDQVEVYLLDDGEECKPRMEHDGTMVSGALTPFEWDEVDYPKHENAICVTREGLCYKWTKNNDVWMWQSVSDKYLIDAVNKTELLNTQLGKVISKDYLLQSDKHLLERVRDALYVQHADIEEALAIIRDNESLRTEMLKKFPLLDTMTTSYNNAYSALISVYNSILGSEEEVIDLRPFGLEAKNTAYNLQYTEIRKVIASMNTYTFELSNEMNVLGNTFFGKDGDGNWVVKKGQLVTEAGAVTMITEQLGDYPTKADMGVAINEGIANAHISAEQIALSGYTTINDGFGVDNDGNMYAEQGVFGGMTKSKFKVVYSGNKEKFGYNSENDFYVDVDKTGSCFMVYDNTYKSDGFVTNASTFGNVIIPLPSFKGYNDASNGKFKEVFDLYQARQYIGKKIYFYHAYSGSLRITGVFNADYTSVGEFFRNPITGGVPMKLLEFECNVVTSSTNGKRELIGWSLVQESENLDFPYAKDMNWLQGTGENEQNRNIFALDTYHFEPDLYAYCVWNQSFTPKDKYIIKQAYDKLVNKYIILSKTDIKGALWETFKRDVLSVKSLVEGNNYSVMGDAACPLFKYMNLETIYNGDDYLEHAKTARLILARCYKFLDSL